MQPFTRLTAIAAPVPEADIDTDILYPARFLTLTAKKGLGRYAFHDRRFDGQGREVADFILNRDPWRHAAILIAGPNFGCGSSREQAPWALLDQGIRCVIASSFGEIFRANCFRNGMLPVILAADPLAFLMEDAQAGRRLTIDLDSQTIGRESGNSIHFDIEPWRRDALIQGWDEVLTILNLRRDAITLFEQARRQSMPWLA